MFSAIYSRVTPSYADTTRALCLIIGIGGFLLCGAASIFSYPIIVIADSDLGSGAMQRVWDAGMLTLFFGLYAALVLLGLLPAVFQSLLACILLAVATIRTPNSSNVDAYQWGQLLLAAAIGLLIPAAWAERWPVAHQCRRFKLVALLIPMLTVAICWDALYCLGWTPRSTAAVKWTAVAPFRSNGGPAIEEVAPASPCSASIMTNSLRRPLTSPSGKVRAWADARGNLMLENAAGRTQVATAGREKGVSLIAFSPDSRLLIGGEFNSSSEDGGNTVSVWDIDTSNGAPAVTIRRQWRPSHYIFALVIAPDNDTVVLVADGVQFLSIASGQVTQELHPDRVPYCVAFSADGTMLATWDVSAIHLWRLPALTPFHSFYGSDQIGCSLAFGHDDQTVIAVGRARRAVWTVRPSWWCPGILLAGLVGMIVMLARDTRVVESVVWDP